MTRESTVPSRPIHYIPVIAALVAMVVGALGLLGGPSGTDLGGTAPGPLVAPVTGIGLLLLGGALLLAWLDMEHPAAHGLRLLLIIPLLLLGIGVLVERAIGIDLGIAHLLSGTTRPTTGIAPASAAGFLLGAAGLLLGRLRSVAGHGASSIAATLLSIVGLITLVGYLYGVPLLYHPFGSHAMTALEAAAFVAIAAGIFTLYPEHGLTSLAARRTVLGAHVRWLLPAAILIPLLVGGVAVQSYEAFGIPRLAIAITAAGTTITIGLVIWLTARLLRRLENRLEVIDRALAGTGQGIFIAGAEAPGYPIVYVNDAFTTISGFTSRDALGRPCDFLAVQVADDTQERAKIAGSLRDGSHRTAVFQARRKDGTIFSCRLSVSGVFGVNGEIDHVVGVLEDVTTEQLAAKARLDLLAEASQARKEAEAANHARDILLASVTHDLRSPLNACQMWVDVMALSPLSDKAAKAIDAIKRNLKLQARLVNDLIDTAKISSGGIEIHAQPTDVAELIHANLDTWRLAAANKGIEFDPRLDDGEYTLEIDPERTIQALNNLVENALSSTDSGGRVELRLREEGSFVLIEITDNGRGLTDDDLQKLFTPFWRGATSDKSHKGLGLGLAIAEHLVSRHDGSLRAASDGPGTGCVFTIRLPRTDAKHTLSNVGKEAPAAS
jgi:PAS domain S-box-containing protein